MCKGEGLEEGGNGVRRHRTKQTKSKANKPMQGNTNPNKKVPTKEPVTPKKIYESPDKGKTIYVRELGDYTTKKVITKTQS